MFHRGDVMSPNGLQLVVALAKKDCLTLAQPEVYRSIRCKLGDDAVWEHFLSNPTHAPRVRELEIQREDLPGRGVIDEEEWCLGTRRAPVQEITTPDKFTTREEVIHSEQLLIRAIRLMVNLENFTWDRWVPEVNHGEEIQTPQQGRLHYETYREDIWTALREYTKLKKLTVVDLGRTTIRPTDTPVDIRSIFGSTIFTLRNLTHLDLKMYYSPDDDMEGSSGEREDDDDDELIPGRVKWERFHDLLSRCPNLESLSLAIYDHDFYYKCGGNPYTNITPIFSKLMGNWRHLDTLNLRDVIVDDDVITTFLRTHTNLRTLSMSLSLSEDDLPELPFDVTDLSPYQILSNIESLHISPPRALRPILCSLKRPSPLLHSLSTLEPRDWNASEELHMDENYVSSLDDVWGYNSPSPATEALVMMEAMMEDISLDGSSSVELGNLLSGISNLRSLAVTDVKDMRQLDKLVCATPELEMVVFSNSFEDLASHRAPHTELISHLSHWSRLTTLYGLSLWPLGDDNLDVSSEFALSIACDIVTECPRLQRVSWIDGTSLTIVKEDGALRLQSQI